MSDASPAQTPDTPARAAARVHDLGYKRYEGERRPQSTRYRTIARKVVSAAWHGWWRMKLWIITAAMTTFVIGTIVYVSEGLSSFLRAGQAVALTDALVPMSFGFFSLSALVVSLTVLAQAVADDLRTGAFEFYFSRPVRPRDYVMGKLGGGFLIMSMILFVGPLLLTLFRIGLLGTERITSSLHLVPKVMAVGALATAMFAALPLAFSAISSRRRHTMIAWAAFYFIAGPIFRTLAMRTGIEELTVLNINGAIEAVAFDLFDVAPGFGHAHPSGWLGLAAIAGYVTLSVVVIHWRVSAAQRAGMGGG
jgi:ABC-2 type transport system permease protein